MTDPADLRKDRRIDTAASGVVAKLQVGTEKNAIDCVVSIRDFSQGGASLYTNFKAPTATPIRIFLEGLTTAWIDGAVAWCTPTQGDADAPAGCTFRMGIGFKPKDRAAQTALAEAFEKISNLADEADDLDE